jgi:hypothetical protein
VPTKSSVVITPTGLAGRQSGIVLVYFSVGGNKQLVATQVKIMSSAEAAPVKLVAEYSAPVTGPDATLEIEVQNDKGVLLGRASSSIFSLFEDLVPSKNPDKSVFDKQELVYKSVRLGVGFALRRKDKNGLRTSRSWLPTSSVATRSASSSMPK